MTRARWLLLPVALAALAALAWWLFPSNARRIRTRFQILATLVSVPAAEQDLARLARARQVGSMLATDIEVIFVEGATPPMTGRDAVVALVALPPAIHGAATVELADVSVEVAPNRIAAATRARARVTFTDPQTQQPSAEQRDVSLDWRKIDSDWVVTAARVGPSAVRSQSSSSRILTRP